MKKMELEDSWKTNQLLKVLIIGFKPKNHLPKDTGFQENIQKVRNITSITTDSMQIDDFKGNKSLSKII